MGQCRYRNGSYTINISCRLLEESVPREILKQTVLHEILHTCKNCMNHKTEWKEVANQVNRAYGYNIKRCTSAEELGLQDVQVKKPINICSNANVAEMKFHAFENLILQGTIHAIDVLCVTEQLKRFIKTENR